MRLKIFICALLAGITLAIYWPTGHFDFVYYDDPSFLDNAEIASGLNLLSLKWAASAVVDTNWHPVTVLSFMVDRWFFGRNPGAEHLVSALIHAANAALLFLVLARMTDAIWRSAMVAAVFAWHPLRVESVVWISERKDVLFLFFMLLALWAYTEYARRQKLERSGLHRDHHVRSNAAYDIFAFVFFILSLMCKPMAVTLPFLLLLLDYWPLQRFKFSPQAEVPSPQSESPTSTAQQLFVEKIPFFALAIIVSALTFGIQRSHHAVATIGQAGITARFANVVTNYIYYLGHFVWPSRLSIVYPYPESFSTIEVFAAALALLGISILCLLEISRRPYLAMGWFWYLGTMIPVIGLVQVGNDAMADRYTYLPLIGPVISLVWLASDWARTHRARISLAATAAAILAACAISTRWQLQFWQNTITLFDHALAVNPAYVYPHMRLATGLQAQKRWREAAVEYQISLNMLSTEKSPMAARLRSYNFRLETDFAGLLGQMGYEKRADACLESALKIQPDSVMTLNNLAWSLATSADANVRDGKRAVELGKHACELTDYKRTVLIGTLAAAYAEAGRFDDAIATARKAIANAQQNGEAGAEEMNQELLQLYLAHKAYHQQASATTRAPQAGAVGN